MTTSEIPVGEEMITRVMRYCDGQLEPNEAEAVAKAIASDPELQALAKDFLESSRLTRETMDAIGNQPVPLKLARSIVTEAAPSRPSPLRAVFDSRIAAAIFGVAVGAGLLGLWSASQSQNEDGLRLAGSPATGPGSTIPVDSNFKDALLSALSSGEETHTQDITFTDQGGRKMSVSVVKWFKLASGASCAEFSLSGGSEGGSTGIACHREDGGWEVMTIGATAQ